MKKADPNKMWKIRVRRTPGGPPFSIYVGTWNKRAATLWEQAREFAERRCVRFVRDVEVMAMLYGHPDMVETEKRLDFVGDFYDMPGDPSDPPNRKGA